MIGIMAAVNGILSIAADIIAATHIRIMHASKKSSFTKGMMNDPRYSRKPLPSTPPTIMKSAIKNINNGISTSYDVEIPLLMFFIALFMIVGGVEGSGFLEYLGSFIIPFVKEDFLLACIILMWVAAIMSAAIDNIPFTAAMIPIIMSMEAQGINAAALWWCLALGVGMGGNGTHIGSTANVFIVTVSERLARDTGDKSMAITPLMWAKKGLPVMLLTLVICSIIIYTFFDYYAQPLK